MKTFLFFIPLTRTCLKDQLKGICRYALKRNWRIQVIERNLTQAQIRETISFWNPAGIFAEYGDKRECLPLGGLGDLPIVFLDIGRRCPKGKNSVSFDSAATGRMGARHLLELGLSHYAYVGFWDPVVWNRERSEAFAHEIRSAGFSCDVFQVQEGRLSESRHRMMLEWLNALPRPCGIMAANDRVAEEVLGLCGHLGISVPEEIAILGVDNDLEICENLHPTLSSIITTPELVGYRAAEMMGRLVSGKKLKQAREGCCVPPEGVVVRQSTRRITSDCIRAAETLEMIRKRACEGIGVADVVKEMGVPRRRAERYFRMILGHTILEEINAVRFEHVYALLRNSNCAIDSIAGQSGFSSEVALRKSFRLREGCSMREWRKRQFK